MPRCFSIVLMAAMFLALTAGAAQEESSSRPAGSTASQAQEQPQASPVSPGEDRLAADHDVEVAKYYMRKGDVDAAIGRLEDAIRLDPRHAEPRLLLAHAYEKKGAKAAAAKSYQEYLRVFPTAPDAAKIQKKIAHLNGQ